MDAVQAKPHTAALELLSAGRSCPSLALAGRLRSRVWRYLVMCPHFSGARVKGNGHNGRG